MRYFLLFFLVLSQPIFSSYLTPQDIETYYQQGYLVKKGALSQEEVLEMDQVSMQVIERAIQEIQSNEHQVFCLDKGTLVEKVIYLNDTQVVFTESEKGSISIRRMVGCGSLEPAFLKMLRSQKILNTFFKLLGTSQIEQIICQYHPKMPGDGVAFPKHIDLTHRKKFDPDWKDVTQNGSYAVCIIPIDSMSRENGGLIVDKKSYPPGSSMECEPEAISMEPGDILFMHPELVHWSEENRSIQSRRTILTGICSYGANHRNYPGDCTNDVFIKTEDGIFQEAAPWKKLGDTDFK